MKNMRNTIQCVLSAVNVVLAVIVLIRTVKETKEEA